MKKIFFIYLLILATSCSTIFNSGSQSFIAKTSSDREGVMVEITTPDGSYRTKLPTTVVATPSSFRGIKIDVVDNCFNSTSYEVKKSITPSFWANILWGVGSLVAMPIDYLDGYMWKFDRMTVVPVSSNGKC